MCKNARLHPSVWMKTYYVLLRPFYYMHCPKFFIILQNDGFSVLLTISTPKCTVVLIPSSANLRFGKTGTVIKRRVRTTSFGSPVFNKCKNKKKRKMLCTSKSFFVSTHLSYMQISIEKFRITSIIIWK